jgi:replicative superfamily II helicase
MAKVSVKKVEDQNVLVSTDQFPHATWGFELFNPIQSRIFETYAEDANSLIAAKTSAGKTCIAEMLISHEIEVRGGKGMFLAPMRALAQEKIDSWTSEDSTFAGKKIAICTGDYRLTPDRHKELAEADVIIMTSEMLNHRSRNFTFEKNGWLRDVGTLIVDESHLLTVPSRGDHLEVGLMKFTEINPDVRLVLLSATMPNVEEIAEWTSHCLTNKDTYYLNSKFRPCKLNVHYENYRIEGKSTYDDEQSEMVNLASDIISHYPDDKFLVFTHTKRTGEKMKKVLREDQIPAEFHHGSLEKAERVRVEREFRDEDLQVVVATSTLAWGMNMPARRVIILGVHRGLSLVESYNIHQMMGRSGRVGLDPCGDAYILLNEKDAEYHKQRVNTPEKIQSQLLAEEKGFYKVLAFHLVSEIYQENIQTVEDVHKWFERSLAYWQSESLANYIVEKTLDDLRKCRAIYKTDDGVWKATAVGKIASIFYMSPFDIANLRENFDYIFGENKQDDPYCLSIALGSIDSQRWGIVTKAEKMEFESYMAKVRTCYGNYFTEAAAKVGYCYFSLLGGMNVGMLSGLKKGLQSDFPRIAQALKMLNTMGGSWNKDAFFNQLESQIVAGVPSHLINLCQIPKIGKIRAKRLYDAGITNVQELADFDDPIRLRTLINLKEESVKEIVEEAERVSLLS